MESEIKIKTGKTLNLFMTQKLPKYPKIGGEQWEEQQQREGRESSKEEKER